MITLSNMRHRGNNRNEWLKSTTFITPTRSMAVAKSSQMSTKQPLGVKRCDGSITTSGADEMVLKCKEDRQPRSTERMWEATDNARIQHTVHGYRKDGEGPKRYDTKDFYNR